MRAQAGSETENGPNPFGPGPPGFENRLRLAHSRLNLSTDRAARPTHTQVHDRNIRASLSSALTAVSTVMALEVKWKQWLTNIQQMVEIIRLTIPLRVY
jgi:hypothetical protein